MIGVVKARARTVTMVANDCRVPARAQSPGTPRSGTGEKMRSIPGVVVAGGNGAGRPRRHRGHAESSGDSPQALRSAKDSKRGT